MHNKTYSVFLYASLVGLNLSANPEILLNKAVVTVKRHEQKDHTIELELAPQRKTSINLGEMKLVFSLTDNLDLRVKHREQYRICYKQLTAGQSHEFENEDGSRYNVLFVDSNVTERSLEEHSMIKEDELANLLRKKSELHNRGKEL